MPLTCGFTLERVTVEASVKPVGLLTPARIGHAARLLAADLCL
jgi:hypothetical protein